MALSTTQQTAQTVLDKESDSRFWAQTGYKVGQKLDMSIPTDRAMAQVWNAIHAQVVAEDNAGTLHLTYNHPAVAQGIANAQAADQQTAANLQAAASALDAATRDQHIAAAEATDQASQANQRAIQQATQHAPPPAHVVTKAATDAQAEPPPRGAGAHHHLGHHQAQGAPHKVTAANAPSSVPPVPPAVPPDELAIARREGPVAAAAAVGNFIGYTRPLGGPGVTVPLSSHDLLVDWYNAQAVAASMTGAYIAAYDKQDPAWAHGQQPIADGIGGEAAIIVSAHPELAPPDPWAGAAGAPPTPPTIEVGPVTVTPSPPPAPPSAPVPDAPNLNVPASPSPPGAIGKGKLIAVGAGVLGALALAYFVFRESPGHPRGGRGSFGRMTAGGTMKVRALPARAGGR